MTSQGQTRGALEGLHVENAMLVALIEATAEKAAQCAAKDAVTETFRLLGIDLNDETELRATREAISIARDQWHAKRDARVALRRVIIDKAFTILISAVVTALGVKLASGG